MAIKEICRLGNPVLRRDNRKLDPAELHTPAFSELLQDMQDTMEHLGGIGLAAPQIGVNQQVAIIQITPDNRYQEAPSPELIVLVNPQIEVLDPTPQTYWEGCLSVPGLRGQVERPRAIRLSYLDRQARPQEWEAEDFLATVIQHECDHLWGVLYVDRLKSTKAFSFDEEFVQFHLDDSKS